MTILSFGDDYGGPKVAILSFGGDYCGPEVVIFSFGVDGGSELAILSSGR